MSIAKQAKYRLALSLQELEHLHHRLHSQEPVQVTEIEINKLLRAKVHIAIVKASEGITKPAFESLPRLSTSEKLGSPLSANERRRLAYDALVRGEELSPQALTSATQYRYDNGLMSEAESDQYELEAFGEGE